MCEYLRRKQKNKKRECATIHTKLTIAQICEGQLGDVRRELLPSMGSEPLLWHREIAVSSPHPFEGSKLAPYLIALIHWRIDRGQRSRRAL